MSEVNEGSMSLELSSTDDKLKYSHTNGSGIIISDTTIEDLSNGVLAIYEKPFLNIENQLNELLLKQNKINNLIQVINNNKDKNYKNKLILLEEISSRINNLIIQIKSNHARMIEITKTVKLMKHNTLKIKKYSQEQCLKRQEELMKEQNLVKKASS